MDNILFASVYQFAHNQLWSDTLVIFFGAYWEYVVGAIFLIYLWFPKFSQQSNSKIRAKIVGLALSSALIARLGIAETIRFFFPKERPFVANGLDALINQNPLESAFPSGHATFFMALAIYFLLAGEKKLGWFLLFSAILISLARVMAGIHWPSDIIAGWIIGAATGWFIFYMTKQWLKK